MIDTIHLSILSALQFALFGGQKPELDAAIDAEALLNEAKAQAVYSLVYSVCQDGLRDRLSSEQADAFDAELFSDVSNCVRVQTEHDELHQIMMSESIPYTVLKGYASAAYYPEPELRSMGDVDFLVYKKDIPETIRLLKKNGFHRDQYEFTTNQSAYLRPPLTMWEIHKEPTGIPKNEVGSLIRKELSNIIEESELYERDGVCFYMPSQYHHGIILLLHKISHMTKTGIGLRHLCDWAVFESSLTDEAFVELFEKPLKMFGIWKFAQIMTSVCEQFLGTPKRIWAQDPSVTPQFLENLMNDILCGGNFGKKDGNRQREIKYLTDREQGTLGNKSLFRQAVQSLNAKVYTDFEFIQKNKVFLPVGWIIEGGKYFYLCTSGKRKSSDTKRMLKEASERKKIYMALHLFEKDQERPTNE